MADETDEREVPDWPIELAEPVARLGPPLEMFRVPRSRAARKAIFGVALILLGAAANYVYWVEFNAQFVDFHLIHFLLLSPIISGIGLIYAAWRDRGLWVLIYPVGLLRWQRGEVVTFPWEEIAELAFFRVVECGRPKRSAGPDGQIETCWLPIVKMGSRALGAHLILRRKDGAEATFPSSFDDFPRLCQSVQEQSFRVIWPEVWSRFAAGKRIRFGAISISLAGVHREGDFLPWLELEDTLIVTGKVQIRSKLLRRSWAEVPLNLVVNPHVFVALLIIGPTYGDEASLPSAT
jgi:hypothetical protein